jgi:hypothetical protein
MLVRYPGNRGQGIQFLSAVPWQQRLSMLVSIVSIAHDVLLCQGH